ncbi:hypothetical protein [Clostridium sp. KNHs205]|uniref:hypothetical protein n=1 Tax=Clostridium sp. KNHs205 TaxID=1449050 RepID=UPI00051C7E9A|nr:hypothetical protein [Clostridium sp. KNHs205]
MNKKNLIRNGVSAVTFGACYALISYLFDRTVDVAEIVVSSIAYFVIMSLLYLIVPKLRK